MTYGVLKVVGLKGCLECHIWCLLILSEKCKQKQQQQQFVYINYCCPTRIILEALINSSDYRSLEHPVTMAFMKVFKTNCVTVVNECQEAFGFDTVRPQIIKRKINFFS